MTTPSTTRGLLVRKLSEVEAQPVEWLWENWIPLGAVTVVAGRPGTGKTWFTIELSAQVSQGGVLPDGQAAPQGDVLVIQIEDSAEHTLKPRLMAAGADQEHIVIVDGVVGAKTEQHRRHFNLADIAALRDCLRSMPNCKMIVIDPLNAFVGARTDIYRDNEVRDLLGPLSELARELKLAMLLVTHHKKGVSDDADSLAMGSTGVVGLARSVIHVMEDPSDPHRRLVVPGKNNLARQQAGFAFRISEGDNPRIVWDEQRIDKNANQVARERGGVDHQRGRKPRQREEAMKWLRQRLRSGPALATTLTDEAKALGISSSTLDRAKAKLAVQSVRQAVDGPWFWSLRGSENNEDVEMAQDNLTIWSHSEALGENAVETPPASAPECDTPPKDIRYQNPMNREVSRHPNEPVLATIPRPTSSHVNGHSHLETERE